MRDTRSCRCRGARAWTARRAAWSCPRHCGQAAPSSTRRAARATPPPARARCRSAWRPSRWLRGRVAPQILELAEDRLAALLVLVRALELDQLVQQLLAAHLAAVIHAPAAEHR